MSDIAAGQLRSFVERIERVEAEIKELNGDKSEIYKEAKGNGFDVKAIRAIVAERRADPAKAAELEAILDLYRSALAGVRVHEAA
jgi:uncharacterized protein (UPF0335 family)